MRKASGLRNKYRSGGKSIYAVRNKSKRADRYGSWVNGIQIRTDLIAGRTVSYNAHTGDWS